MSNQPVLLIDPIGDNDELVFKVWAKMMHPNDDAKREDCFHAIVADTLKTHGVQNVLFEDNAAAAMVRYGNNLAKPSIMNKGGCAGAILLYMLAMKREGINSSLNKAIYLYQNDFAKNATNMRGESTSIHHTSKVIDAWVEYKEVAQLWAGFQLGKNQMIEKQDWFVVISMAKEIAKNAKERNFNFNFWDIPEGGRHYDMSKNSHIRLSQKQKDILKQKFKRL